jgi:hypothetical protein
MSTSKVQKLASCFLSLRINYFCAKKIYGSNSHTSKLKTLIYVRDFRDLLRKLSISVENYCFDSLLGFIKKPIHHIILNSFYLNI